MLRQPIVRKGVVGEQQIRHAAILPKLIADEQLRFHRHRFAQVLVEFGIQLRVGDEAGDLAQLEPSRREPLDERVRARIAQHAAHLLLEHGGILQLAARGDTQQLFVGNAAPQEKRQLRREVQVGSRRTIHSEDEARRGQHALEAALNAGVERLLFRAAGTIEVEKNLRLWLR